MCCTKSDKKAKSKSYKLSQVSWSKTLWQLNGDIRADVQRDADLESEAGEE